MGPTVSPEALQRWQGELDRTFRQLEGLRALVGRPSEPKIGQTPGGAADGSAHPGQGARMGAERLADVIERFTDDGGGPGAAASSETTKQWQEEFDRNFRRFRNLHALVTRPVEPKVGQTPREEVYKKNKSRLYRYASTRRYRTPLLFVPNLGISRPYIFDLLPGGSFIEHMTREGFDFYLLDWASSGPRTTTSPWSTA